MSSVVGTAPGSTKATESAVLPLKYAAAPHLGIQIGEIPETQDCRDVTGCDAAAGHSADEHARSAEDEGAPVGEAAGSPSAHAV